ncbi:MAG: M20/M25/M40 family metallo-hydrolase [Gemmatimonadetes bacterium]|nr:M20/M25/M40 family metallo-hydrolase [Gemmatimonadota bacterium]
MSPDRSRSTQRFAESATPVETLSRRYVACAATTIALVMTALSMGTGRAHAQGGATGARPPASTTVPRPDAQASAVRKWREQHEVEIVRELTTLLEIPNRATDRANILRNANLIKAMLERRGLAAQLLENGEFPPTVFGELRVPGATRTVMFYAHYDGQPVTVSEWATPAYSPTLRAPPQADGSLGAVRTGPVNGRYNAEDRIYARSASDDKSPIVALMSALDAMRATGQLPSVNVKFFFEGEEEAGSAHLSEILAKHKELVAADVWLICDGPAHQSRDLQIVFGVRGVMGFDATVYGPARALHSGHYGNWAPNPAMLITELIASLRNSDGRILVDRFYDDVVPPTASELAAARALPPVEADMRRALLLGASEAGNAPIAERIMLPALNIHGIKVGEVGELSNNAIPTEA